MIIDRNRKSLIFFHMIYDICISFSFAYILPIAMVLCLSAGKLTSFKNYKAYKKQVLRGARGTQVLTDGRTGER